MEPGHSRLVVEIPTDVYEKLEELQRVRGTYKKAIVAALIIREYGHHLKAETRRQTNEENHESLQ